MSQMGIENAIAAAGSQANLARVLGVTPVAVCNWTRRGWVPLRRAMEIENLLGVPRADTMNPRIRDLVDLNDEV
jgi:DNA-binding transcriptional regulator YdaS (Cro superfamily)